MNYTELFDGLGLKDDGRRAFEKIDSQMSDLQFSAAFNNSLIAFGAGDKEFGEYIEGFATRENLTVEELTFYVYMRLAMRAIDTYIEKEIDVNIFFATMKTDVIPSCEAYYNKYGVYGISKKARRWLGYPLDCKIFNLGILRFQIAPSRYDCKIGEYEIKKGEPCISVHIPKGNLDEDECEASYALARDFFARYFNMTPPIFFCYSWIMQPWLLDVVPEVSRIYRFQIKYENIDFVEDLDDVLRWVFPKICENVEDYPEETIIQRATKERLRRGEIIGYGSGVRL